MALEENNYIKNLYQKDEIDSQRNLFNALDYFGNKEFEKAREEILMAMKNNHPNYDFNHYLDRANLYKEKGSYLESLNYYEQAFAQVENLHIKKILKESIKNFQNKYYDEIEQELNLQRINKREHFFIENLHLLIDNIYCDKYIDFINENLEKEKHFFLILSFEKELKYIKTKKYDNVKIFWLKSGWEKCLEDTTLELLHYFNLSDKVTIHYMHDYITWFICRFNINKFMSWQVWGSDLYNSVKILQYDNLTETLLDKESIKKDKENPYMESNEFYYKRSTIRRLSRIYCFDKDYEIIKNNFLTKATYHLAFYPNPVDFIKLNEYKKTTTEIKNPLIDKNFKYFVLIGNSGDPAGNQLEIFHMLKKLKSNEIGIICPLSYGDSEYIEKVIKEGYRILGDQFIPLTEFLSETEYFSILNRVDVAIMNHNIAQGVGNILALLYLGKKVFLKESVSTYAQLKELGIKVFSLPVCPEENLFEQIFSFDDCIKENNRKIIFNNFNEKTFVQNYRRLL